MFILARRKHLRLLLWLLLFTCGASLGPTFLRSARAYTPSFIALVIDDLGNNGEGLAEMLDLGILVTAAVLPFLPYSRHDADLARRAGHEVILHLPMESIRGRASCLGAQPIVVGLDDAEIKARVERALADIGPVAGINNHMGDRATRDPRVMRNVLVVIKERGLYFVDSRTADCTVIATAAKAMHVPCLRRNVFLDGVKNEEFVRKRLIFLAKIAQAQGCAVGIGHVGPEGGLSTVRGIKRALPELRRMGIEFVPASRLLGMLPFEDWLASGEADYLNDWEMAQPQAP